MIYLDNAATTQMSQGVLEAMELAMRKDYGNPGAIYSLGEQAAALVLAARRKVADTLHASEDQIIFTSGGSESNTMVFNGIVDWMSDNGKDTVIVSSIEHESVLKSAQEMCDDYGFRLLRIEVDSFGCINRSQLLSFLNSYRVGLVSIMYMNNEIGTIQNRYGICELAKECHKRGALFHTDCVQAFSAIPIDVSVTGCDFLSVSSHKIHGPKGVGALYVSDRSTIRSLIHGGNAQEYGLRGGTENVPGIVGFGVACQELKNDLDAGLMERISALRFHFFMGLHNECVKNGMENAFLMNGEPCKPGNASAKIISLTVQGVDNESLAMLLSSKGICVGTGSACNSHEVTPSHVLKAIGMSDDKAMSTIRISFSKFNTEEEVAEAAVEIVRCAKLLLEVPSNNNV